MKTITAFVVRAIAFCIALSALGHARRTHRSPFVCSWYAATHFSMTTDINQLISTNSPGRQRELAFEKAFPQFDTIIAVVDAPTPELVQEATRALGGAAVAAEKICSARSRSRRAARSLRRTAFCSEPSSSLSRRCNMLTQAQRLIQVLAADPSLRGAIRALQFGLLGVQSGKLKLDDMTWPLTLAAETIEQVNAGKPASFSWQALVQGHEPKPSELMRFLKIQAVLDYSELRARAQGERRHPQGRRRPQPRIRLSGARAAHRPGAHERRRVRHHQGERRRSTRRITIAVVLFILWMALRWFRIIFAVFVSLIVGLSVTAALGMLSWSARST